MSLSATSVGSTSCPSALAVLRLITSSKLLGCMTGRSDAFAPAIILPAYTPIWRYASGRCGPNGGLCLPGVDFLAGARGSDGGRFGPET
jgi:hypothetical protein